MFISAGLGAQASKQMKKGTTATTGTSATNVSNTKNLTEDSLSLGQKNALRAAKNYLSVMSFSRSGLIEQLEFEGYSTEEATFAVNNCGANWNEQAALKAKSYLDLMAFSKDGLIDQLEFEGFTSEQANYGVKAVGY